MKQGRIFVAGGLMMVALLLVTATQFGAGRAGHAMFTDVTPPDMVEARVDATGACWSDFDGDGDEDLFVANISHSSHLWRNEGAGRFTDVAEAAGVISRRSQRFGGCAFVDLDNDGDLDLYVTGRSDQKEGERPNRLFENLGNGRFRDRTTDVVAREGISSNASDWADYDNDGDIDGYVASRAEKEPNAFLEQIRPFEFRDVGPDKRLADVEGPDTAFLGSWFDYDTDGDADLIIAQDFWGLELYRNDAGQFIRATTEALPLAKDDTPGAPPNNAMGIGWGDYDNDGCIDAFVTGVNLPRVGGFDAETMTDVFSRLYRNRCDGIFVDATQGAGFRPTGLTEWSASFVDFDNDGDLDLSVVAGSTAEPVPLGGGKRLRGTSRKLVSVLVTGLRRIIPSRYVAWAYRYELMIPASGASGQAASMPNLLYRNLLVESGRPRFVDVTESVGIRNIGAARGSAWADMDNDGDLDWFAPNRRTPNRLFRNNGPVGNYLRVHLVGAKQRQAIGAWVKIKAGAGWQTRHVHVLDGYLSQSQTDPHFGLGKAGVIDEIWIRWPNTATWVHMCDRIPANSKVIVTEGAGCR